MKLLSLVLISNALFRFRNWFLNPQKIARPRIWALPLPSTAWRPQRCRCDPMILDDTLFKCAFYVRNEKKRDLFSGPAVTRICLLISHAPPGYQSRRRGGSFRLPRLATTSGEKVHLYIRTGFNSFFTLPPLGSSLFGCRLLGLHIRPSNWIHYIDCDPNP